MRITNSSYLFLIILFLGVLPACKKDKDATPEPPPPTTGTGTAADKIKDSVLMYAREIYLWHNQIPASFNPRNYSDPNAIMNAIRQFSMEPGYTAPVDKWSFAMKQAEWDQVSSGIAGDFGLGIFFHANDDLRVKSVEKDSPAGKAGIRRGWRITKINGNSTINTSESSINFVVQTVFQSTNTSFTFQKPDGSTVDITLNVATYRENPIYFDSVYNVNNKKVGYLVFNSFLGDSIKMFNDFQRIFTGFAQAGVTDVVVDLRYNGGGYVNIMEKLANYIVPSSANGSVMMKREYNNKYAHWNSTTHFNKIGNLNPKTVVFVVSSSSASASETLINSLKPHMEVVLVGPSKTYGKPVGYFPIEVGDWYIFPVSSRSTNSRGEANFFGGFQLNHQIADGLDKDWGDLNESAFRSAIAYITTGAFKMQAAGSYTRPYTVQPEVKAGNQVLDEPSFKGAIDRRKIKLEL